MHKAVLLKEAIEGLELKPGETFLDGTLGGGGHSGEALRSAPGLRVIGLDQDPEAVARATAKLGIETKVSNFRNLDQALSELGIEKVDAILLDIGLSSDQLESSGRGFSFQKDEPLDMRMSSSGISAADILNSWDEPAIELILRGFGEERYSKRIAAEIAKRREAKPFERTAELVEVVAASKPKSFRDKIHPATKTFQALRIAVNEELTALEEGITKGFEALNPGGRLAVITFHSLEDRIVKNFFRGLAEAGRGTLMNKKPIVASESETSENPRSRSAKLRIIKKS
jgi:16S rRNA (cytosine1402-N4)-methyltransferase